MAKDLAGARSALSTMFLGVSLVACGAATMGENESLTSASSTAARSGGGKGDDQGSVSARLGGFDGILGFLEKDVVPAELGDPEIAAFFTHLTESPGDIEQCLARLLDHDLGGRSPHFGAVLADGHQCRSSMSNIHRGLNIPDRIVDKFILIVGQQATLAGVAPADIQEVAKTLDKYRGGVRNK
jgi:hypothetical protein